MNYRHAPEPGGQGVTIVKQAHLSGQTGYDRSRQSFATILRELVDRIGVDGRRVTMEAGLGYGDRMIKVLGCSPGVS
jgi:hypothetical protein